MLKQENEQLIFAIQHKFMQQNTQTKMTSSRKIESFEDANSNSGIILIYTKK